MKPQTAEQVALEQLDRLLGSKQEAILDAGLRVEVRGPERAKTRGGETSEIGVLFYTLTGEFEDAIEFFVVWNDRVNDSEVLVREVADDVNDVIRRFKEKQSHER